MKEECIICKAPLIYLEKDEMMECVLCHKKELSKTRCEQGHYVSDNALHISIMSLVSIFATSHRQSSIYQITIHIDACQCVFIE